jgi:hypothetical protein
MYLNGKTYAQRDATIRPQHNVANAIAVLLTTATIAIAHADSALRAALNEVWPRYQSIRVLLDYTNECQPANANKNRDAFATWSARQGLSDQIQSLFDRTFSAREVRSLRTTIESQGRTKFKEMFPNCVTSEQFVSLLQSPTSDLQKRHGQAIAVIASATGQDTPNVASSATPKKTPSADAAPPANSAQTANAAPQTSANQSDLEGVYLDQSYSYGVGGMTTIDFDSYAVFKDGTICENIDTIVRGHSAQAKGCGQWTRKGNGFSVRWNKGKNEELGGSTFYRTHPAASGERLNGRYTSLGGGGNTALGGDTMIFASQSYVFHPDGRFESAKSGGGGNSGVTTLASRSQSGTYALDRNVIEMRFGDGKTIRTGFFFFPSHGKKTHGSIGIGETVYSLRK